MEVCFFHGGIGLWSTWCCCVAWAGELVEIVHIIVDIYEVDLQLFLVDISGVQDGGAQVCSLQKI